MLGTVLNTLLLPFYIAVVILIFLVSTAVRIVGSISNLLSEICDILGDLVSMMVKAIGKL